MYVCEHITSCYGVYTVVHMSEKLIEPRTKVFYDHMEGRHMEYLEISLTLHRVGPISPNGLKLLNAALISTFRHIQPTLSISEVKCATKTTGNLLSH